MALLQLSFNLDLSGKLVVLAMLIISLGIHEAAHAWVAYKCGDTTAKDLGRMTINPIVHIDLMMTIVVPAVMYYVSGVPFGGAKPVPVVPHRLKKPLRDMMLVALAGPFSNFLLAILFMVAFKLSILGEAFSGKQLPNILTLCVYVNVWLAVFNMLPIPPLDGSRVMAYFLPSGLREPYVALERFGLLILIGLIVLSYQVPFIARAVWVPLMGAIEAIIDFIYILTGGAW